MADCYGAGFLIFDIATLGSGSLLKGGLKTVAKEGAEVMAKESVENVVEKSFLDRTFYTNKVLGQMKTEAFHAFPESVTAFETYGNVSKITGGDGIIREMLIIPGQYGSKNVFFEFIKESNGAINHRFFKPIP